MPVSFYYYTWHLTLRCNRPLKTAIYISLCSTASGEHPLFDPWEKWPPKIHFVLPNLRTTGPFLSRGPFLRSSLRLLAVFGRLTLISRLSVPRPFPERIVERLEESASRSMARETNETRGNRLCYSVASPPRLPPFASLLPFLCGEFVFRGVEREAPRRPVLKRENFFTNICLLGLLSIYER